MQNIQTRVNTEEHDPYLIIQELFPDEEDILIKTTFLSKYRLLKILGISWRKNVLQEQDIDISTQEHIKWIREAIEKAYFETQSKGKYIFGHYDEQPIIFSEFLRQRWVSLLRELQQEDLSRFMENLKVPQLTEFLRILSEKADKELELKEEIIKICFKNMNEYTCLDFAKNFIFYNSDIKVESYVIKKDSIVFSWVGRNFTVEMLNIRLSDLANFYERLWVPSETNIPYKID